MLRRGRALPRAFIKAARSGTRLSGALWLDVSTALLSSRASTGAKLDPNGSVRPGSPCRLRLVATLIASALATHCALISGGAATTPPPPSLPAPAHERCAVCFSGWMGVSVYNGGDRLVENLIKPLKAEVVLALTHHPSDGCDSIESCRINERLPALRPYLAKAGLSPMLPYSKLLKLMEGLPHWNTIIRAYARPGSKVTCARVEGTVGDGGGNTTDASQVVPTSRPAYKCKGIYLGNTIFAPILGSVRLHVLRQLHDIRRCLGLLSTHEASAGFAYDRIVHTRLEYVWLKPHPPLSLLITACRSFTPP